MTLQNDLLYNFEMIIIFYSDKKKCDFVCFTEPIYNKNYSSSFFLFTRKENYHVESKISRLL